ncbi:MAG: hypothetical protein J6D08_04205 [Lachnospiraceae bacterium]|nr:hypothetical protein [Lachnospiraceae bacterium]
MSRKKSGRTENQGAPRLGFNAYNISRKRYIELRNGCVAGKYTPEMLSRACKDFKFLEPWILLSVTKTYSYDAMIIKWELKELERPAVGRSDFYGYRRKFYYNLDVILREECSA